MWVLKLEIENKKSEFNRLVHEFAVTMYGYPLTTYSKRGQFYVVGGGTIHGDEQVIKEFLATVKKNKQFTHLEFHNGFLLLTLKQPKAVLPLYSPELIHLEPACLTPDFTQTYTVASWNKRLLDKLALLKFKNGVVRVKKFRREKISGITFTASDAELTDKQRQAFELAYTSGYYDVPRKTGLVALAKKMKLSLATYQVHLRKAEKTIMTFFTKFR